MLKFALIYNALKFTPLSEDFIRRYIQNPVFIVGSQRSGTGFLMSVINQSPKICNWSEANYVWEPHYYDFIRSQSKPWIPGFIGNGIHAHEIPEEYKEETRKRVQKLFSLYVFTSGKERLLHKNPFNSVRLEELIDFFPDAKIIHMNRDLKAVVNSTLNRNKSSSHSREDIIKMATYRWYVCNANFESFVNNHLEQTRKIRYADLGSDRAESIIADLFDFLGLEKNEKVQEKLNAFENRNYKYKEDLSDKEQDLIQIELKKLRACAHLSE